MRPFLYFQYSVSVRSLSSSCSFCSISVFWLLFSLPFMSLPFSVVSLLVSSIFFHVYFLFFNCSLTSIHLSCNPFSPSFPFIRLPFLPSPSLPLTSPFFSPLSRVSFLFHFLVFSLCFPSLPYINSPCSSLLPSFPFSFHLLLPSAFLFPHIILSIPFSLSIPSSLILISSYLSATLFPLPLLSLFPPYPFLSHAK